MAKTVLRFMACSDLHYKDDPECKEKKRFEAGLRQLYAYAEKQEYKNVDAVYIVGDFATSGSQNQMEMVKESLDRGIRPGTLVNLALASHEYWAEDGEDGARARFTALFGQDPDTHRVINGFHFISVTTTDGCRFHGPQKAFCRQALAEAHADTPKKPIFFFQHPHPTDTVYGSFAWGTADLIGILMNYPQAITFSGHSHAPVNDPRSIHQEHFTSVGTGTFSYFELDEFDKFYGTCPPRCEEAAQMLIVEARDDGSVRILPYDVLTNRPFHAGWEIKTPWDPDSFEYTREKRLRDPAKLFFDDGAKAEACVDGAVLRVTFDHACSDERVNDYVLTFRKNGIIERRLAVWSPYFLSELPEEMEVRLPLRRLGFETGEYELTIRARGFWDNSSENTLSCPVVITEIPSGEEPAND